MCIKVMDADSENSLVLYAKEVTLSMIESGCVLKDK